jgi:hypothetical protein
MREDSRIYGRLIRGRTVRVASSTEGELAAGGRPRLLGGGLGSERSDMIDLT